MVQVRGAHTWPQVPDEGLTKPCWAGAGPAVSLLPREKPEAQGRLRGLLVWLGISHPTGMVRATPPPASPRCEGGQGKSKEIPPERRPWEELTSTHQDGLWVSLVSKSISVLGPL